MNRRLAHVVKPRDARGDHGRKRTRAAAQFRPGRRDDAAAVAASKFGGDTLVSAKFPGLAGRLAGPPACEGETTTKGDVGEVAVATFWSKRSKIRLSFTT
jgi:hypothetical protein